MFALELHCLAIEVDPRMEYEIMEEMEERQGFFGRIASRFHRVPEEEAQYMDEVPARPGQRTPDRYRYTVTVRRQIVTFHDAVAAADGLKRGEQQILNLSMAPREVHEKIKDFMSGVGYGVEATWEALGEGVYLLAPANALVEVAPASERMTADRN